MPKNNIIVGQKIDPAKAQRARELRRQMTSEEKALWQRLRANRLEGFHFRRQQVIDGFIVDFYCHAAGLVVETDGEIHRERADYDAERDRVLSTRGLRIVRIRNEEIRRDIWAVVERILNLCREKTEPPQC